MQFSQQRYCSSLQSPKLLRSTDGLVFVHCHRPLLISYLPAIRRLDNDALSHVRQSPLGSSLAGLAGRYSSIVKETQCLTRALEKLSDGPMPQFHGQGPRCQSHCYILWRKTSNLTCFSREPHGQIAGALLGANMGQNPAEIIISDDRWATAAQSFQAPIDAGDVSHQDDVLREEPWGISVSEIRIKPSIETSLGARRRCL